MDVSAPVAYSLSGVVSSGDGNASDSLDPSLFEIPEVPSTGAAGRWVLGALALAPGAAALHRSRRGGHDLA